MNNPGRNSVVQCLAARPIHVAAAARHIMETYSSEQDYTPVGNKCVFFFFSNGLICITLLSVSLQDCLGTVRSL